MGLFSDFYNTVAKFFRPQEEPIIGDASKSVATNRLKLVLMQDRTNLTPKVLEQMRGELVDLLSKYLEMDKDLLELNFEHEGDQVALMLSIPVIRAKDEDEIEEALKNSSASSEEIEEDEESDDNIENVQEESEDEDSVIDKNEITNEDNESEIIDNNDEDEKPKKKKRSSKKVSNPVSQAEENIQSETDEVLSEVNE